MSAVTMAELRSVLAESFPGAQSAIARGLGIDQRTLIQRVERGELEWADAVGALVLGLFAPRLFAETLDAESPIDFPVQQRFREVVGAAWRVLGTGRAVSLVVDGEVVGTLEPWGGVDLGAESGDRSAEWPWPPPPAS